MSTSIRQKIRAHREYREFERALRVASPTMRTELMAMAAHQNYNRGPEPASPVTADAAPARPLAAASLSGRARPVLLAPDGERAVVHRRSTARCGRTWILETSAP